jgi:DNA-binding response OmpR family regulator
MGQAPILLVNNEPDLVTLVRYMLAGAVQVVHATSADDALSRIHMHLPEVIVLDFLLPGFDGLAFCRRLKHMPLTAATPIMVLTDGETEADFIARLELGITDSLSKAWSPRVLVAYIRAMLRRKNGAARSAAESIMHGDLVINPGRHEVRVEHQPVPLTLTEFRILHLLAQRPGWVFSRLEIVNMVRGENANVTVRSVDVHVAALRRKLGQYGRAIETVRGGGYRLQMHDACA